MEPAFALDLLRVYVGTTAPASVLEALDTIGDLLDNEEAVRVNRWHETFNAVLSGAAEYQDPQANRQRAKQTADICHGPIVSALIAAI